MTTVAQADLPSGVHDLPIRDYHALPHLSSTGARKLLPPSCPALFRWWLDHPDEPKETFDFGHAAHLMVLGTGPELVVIDAPDWRQKADRDDRDAARDEGKVPVLRKQYEAAVAMAGAVRAHPIAGALLDPTSGKPEQTLIWTDRETGVECRALIDFLPTPGHRTRYILTDFKSTASAEPDAFSRSVASFGYAVQSAHYLDGIQALGIDDDPAFVFVATEKNPPYLTEVYQLDREALDIGRSLARRARQVYMECQERGEWPGYSDGAVQPLSMPAWAQARMEMIA